MLHTHIHKTRHISVEIVEIRCVVCVVPSFIGRLSIGKSKNNACRPEYKYSVTLSMVTAIGSAFIVLHCLDMVDYTSCPCEIPQQIDSWRNGE